MATLLERSFTAADGTAWDAAGFRRVYGAGVQALVYGGKGEAGTLAAERVYLVTGYPQSPSVKVLVDLDWWNAAGAGRVAGIALRFTQDGLYGYTVELDSNFGASRLRIRRRYNGTWSDVLAWTAVAVSAANLNAGGTFEARIENPDADTVNLRASWNGTQLAEADDTAVTRIESGGTAGLYLGSTSTGQDVTYDNLTVRDFEDEYAGAPADLDADVALVVDGVSYAWADLVAAGVVVGTGRQALGNDGGVVWQFRTAQRFDVENQVLYAGAVVSVALDGTVVAFGRLHPVDRNADPGEGQTFELVGPEQLAADVLIQDPVSDQDFYRWNLPAGHEEYDALRAGKTVGEAIAELLDDHVDGDGGLRDQLAAPPDETTPPYLEAELDLLTAVVPEIEARGDVWAGVQALCSFTKYVPRIDPATRQWRFVDRTAGAAKDIDLAASRVTGRISMRLRNAFTRILVRGQKVETSRETFTNELGGGLDDGWPTGLEASHDSGKAYRNRDTGTVDSTGTSGSDVTLTPDPVGPPAFSMEAGEWIQGVVEFQDGAEVGQWYRVKSNTTLALTLVGGWKAGGPAPGDTFVVRGDQTGGGRDNGHRILGRRFTLSDPGKGIPPDACAQIKIRQGEIEVLTTGVVSTPEDPADPAEVVSDLPVIGLINRFADAKPDPCAEGDYASETPATIEISVPTFSRSDPRVPTMLRPAEGFYGTAFKLDPDTWGVAGAKPGRGDPGVMRTYPLGASGFTGAPDQVTAYQKVCDDLLAFLAMIPWEVEIALKGVLDASWAGLAHTVTISDSSGRRSLAFLDGATLKVYAVEWDVAAKVTRIFAGSRSAGSFDVEAQRRALAAKYRADRTAREQMRLEDLLACAQGARKGGGTVKELPPQQICAEQVRSSVRAAGSSVKNDLLWIEVLLDMLIDIMALQKGFTIEADGDGNVSGTDSFGQTWTFDPNTGLWTRQSDSATSDAPWNEPPPGAPVSDRNPDSIPIDGIEGTIWRTIEGILANLGKTVDDEGNVLAPGTVAPTGGTTYDHDAAGEITEAPVTPGGVVPPTVLGGLLGNAVKTVKLGTGEVLAPGTVL